MRPLECRALHAIWGLRPQYTSRLIPAPLLGSVTGQVSVKSDIWLLANWVQEKLRTGTFRFFKHPGADNPGDICTKHVPNDVLTKHLPNTNMHATDGRAYCAPDITEKRGTTNNQLRLATNA